MIIDPGHRNNAYDVGAIGYNNINTNPPRDHQAFRQDRYTLDPVRGLIPGANNRLDFFEHTGLNANDPNFNPQNFPIRRFEGEMDWEDSGYESFITMQIADELATRLEALSATVSLTRASENQSITLENRRIHANRIANNIITNGYNDRHRAVFISIHCNSSAIDLNNDGYINIYEGYYFRNINVRRATLLFRHTNDGSKSTSFIECLRNTIRVRDNQIPSIRTADYAVIRDNLLPAVLIETDFITNQEAYNDLTNSTVQQRIAQQIVTAIENYFTPPKVSKVTITQEQDGKNVAIGGSHPAIPGRVKIAITFNETMRKESWPNDDVDIHPIVRIDPQGPNKGMGPILAVDNDF